MNITRNNYEEYFILYLDNELGSDDRRQVELFVEENADLKGEFDLLSQTRLAPDDAIVFDEKQQLLNIASTTPINNSNFEEWLVLYIDDELTGQQKISVEEFLVNHPTAKTELEILQKTKLHSEQAVVFRNKEMLYRREEKVPVIAFSWRKMAVAASLLLAISTAAFLVYRNSNEGKIISESSIGTNSTKDDSPDKRSTNPAVTDPVKSGTKEVIEEEVEPVNNSLPGQQKNLVENKRNEQHSTPAAKRGTELIAESKSTPTTNIPTTPAQNSSENKDVDQRQIAMADIPATDPLTINNDNKPTEVVTTDDGGSYNNGETAGSKNSFSPIDIDESGKKNKFRGLFRKVTRTFEKRTNIKATDDEDRLLVAGLAIKL